MAECGQLAVDSTQQPTDNPEPMPCQSANSCDNDQLMPPPPTPPMKVKLETVQTQDVEIAQEEKKGDAPPASQPADPAEETRPYWMKVRKISNKERRRRQNRHLRRLLTPKNAVMVLNEMFPKDQISSNTRVEAAQPSAYSKLSAPFQQSYSVDLTVDGLLYKGFGENKVSARNAAAELAFRDIMLKRMLKASLDANSVEQDSANDDEVIPMIQLASFALHKLFTEWECDGMKVPLIRPPAPASEAECECEADAGAAGAGSAGGAAGVGGGGAAPRAKKAKVLPQNARAMHPCMLLTYMRPALEYRDVSAEGARPQTMLFTVALDVNGTTYLGKASNKREARKAAARAACLELFDIEFEPNSSETVPVF